MTPEGRRVHNNNLSEETFAVLRGGNRMETKLERIADKSTREDRPIFTSLYHLLNEELLLQCHKELDGRKAVGVDGVTKEEYNRNLEANIKALVQKLKNKSYKPLPSLRVYIDKGNGKKRPLGLASYEDKIVQLGLKKILEAVYEPKFKDNMYGFRPNRDCHMAIKNMCTSIIRNRINYVVDADIKGFFNNMNHDWIIEFVRYYIQDPNILRLIKKYLKAGVMEAGEYKPDEEGSAQGNIISPLIANIYMHHALILWFKVRIEKQCKGGCFLVAYADDYVAGFENKWEAEEYYRQMQERLNKFGLEIETSKSRLIEFGRYAAERRARRGEGKPETFDFLGFTFYCGTNRQGKFCVIPRTSGKKYRAKVKAMKHWLRTQLTAPIKQTMGILNRKLIGHFRYYGVTYNVQMLVRFHWHTTKLLFRMMNRRSQKRSYNWETFRKMLEYYPLARPKRYVNLYA
jgi:group II intron reverse transcriptase/maturase